MKQKLHLSGLDYLRALAITLVFLFHYRLFAHPGWIETFDSFGWTGVDLFFVLSGYLIARQIFEALKGGGFSLADFYIKRSFRILPAYWTVLALYFCLPAFREWEALAPLWKYLTFTQNIHLDRGTQRTFSHAWSLCIEEQFYLLLPFLSILIAKTQNRYAGPLLMVILVLFGWAIRVYSWDTHVAPVQASGNYGTPWFKFIYYPTYNRLDPLLAGVAIAGIFSYFPRIAYSLQHKHRMTLTGGLLLLSAAYFLCRDFMSYHASIYAYPIIAGGYGLLVLHAISTGSLLYRYPLRLTAVVAKLSYALYLVHKATIHLSHDWFSAWGVARESNLMFFLSLATSLAAAALLHFIIEKPFHNIREQILHRRAAKQARHEPAQKDLVQAGA